MPLHEYNLVAEDTLKLIDAAVDALNLPTSVETCCKKTAADISLSRRGYTRNVVVGGLIYSCCRKHDVYKPAVRIGQALHDEPLGEGAKQVRSQIIQVHREVVQEAGFDLGPLQPVETLPSFQDKIAVPDDVRQRAAELCRAMEDNTAFVGRNPLGLAAAALYIAAIEETGHRIPQDLVVEASSCSEPTISSSKQLIREELLEDDANTED